MAVPRGALALIPARGGSKGIPGKNLQEVGGLPLVCRSIRAAQASNDVGRVMVSTDDDAIAAAAEAEGAGVIRRPAAIAGDAASSESALLHALDVLEQQGPLETELVFLQYLLHDGCPDRCGAGRPKTRAILQQLRRHPGTALWRADGRGINHDPAASPTPPGPGTGVSGNRRDLRHERGGLPALRQRFCPPSRPVVLKRSGRVDTLHDLDLCRSIAAQEGE